MMRANFKEWETKWIYRTGNVWKLSMEYAGDMMTSVIIHNDGCVDRNC